jgi:hypothetical protein
MQPTDALRGGMLHAYIAFDWGEENDLNAASQLVPAERQTLGRRPRTPASVTYRPTPLRVRIDPLALDLPGCADSGTASAELTIFDFAGVSLALHVPLEGGTENLQTLAARLLEPGGIVRTARDALSPLHERLKPAIDRPAWSELSEEYFVFQFEPSEAIAPSAEWLDRNAPFVAGLVRLEDDPLSEAEVVEAVKQKISYTPLDLLVVEWSASLLIDRDCDETLKTIEFANLQLLEYRLIDDRLDDRLKEAYKLVHPRLPWWRSRVGTRLRELGELRMEAHHLYERTGNALKLVGDQYVARAYQMLSARFHLDEWERSIERSLTVVEGVYQIVSDESDTKRSETLEWIVIILIAFEVVMSMLHGR